MAYLSPSFDVTCPVCNLAGRVVEVVSEGPMSRKGDIAARSAHKTGPFTREVDASGRRTSNLICPNDGTVVWKGRRGARAFGPMTQTEIERGSCDHMIPGTRPKYRMDDAGNLQRIDPKDPFS